MDSYEPNLTNQIISAWGPFFASLITGIMIYLAAKVQGKSTLDAAIAQSNATIETMEQSINSKSKQKRIETLQKALTELLLNLYLIERDSSYYFLNEKSVLYSIANLQTSLGDSEKENFIRKLLNSLLNSLINNGDLSKVPKTRIEIEETIINLLSENEKKEIKNIPPKAENL